MKYFDYLQEHLLNNTIMIKITLSVLIILILIFISRVIKNVLHRRIEDNKKYYSIKRKINYIVGIIITVVIIAFWFDSISDLTTYLGLLSAGIAIALKEVFVNIVGWIFIETRKPFEVGHRILIGEQRGDVIDKRMFQFTIMEVTSFEDGEQSTGRIVDIPNSYIFSYPTVNYTKGFNYIWNELKILLTFDSNWQKAKEIFLDIANKESDDITEIVDKQLQKATKKYMIFYNKLTPIVYTNIQDCGIQLTIRYLCEPKKRRTTSNRIWEDVLMVTSKNNDIELAYPTKTVINKT